MNKDKGKEKKSTGDTRTDRQRRIDRIQELLRPGEGLLQRAQLVDQTAGGVRITPGQVPLMLTVAEQEQKVANARTPAKLRTLLSPPYNQISVVTEHIGLTGIGGLVVERLKQSFTLPVRCMINVTVEAPRFVFDNAESYRVPVQDDHKENIGIYFDEVTAKLEEVRLKGQGVSVVHCMVGVSRSASFVLAYLIRYKHMSLEQAFRHVKQSRSVINPNLGFLLQLAEYESKCHGAAQCSPWRDFVFEGVTKRLPEFIIADYLDEYEHEFEV